MSKAREKSSGGIQLSRQAFKLANLGHSFAEHDLIKSNPGLFVETPAILAATTSSKCFFIGRRGTGKTAITFYLLNKYQKNTLLLLPKLLSAGEPFIAHDWTIDVHQKPFATLVSAFMRVILDEVVLEWRKQGLFSFRSSEGVLVSEREQIESLNFDLRLMTLVEQGFKCLKDCQTREWLAFRNRPKAIAKEMTDEFDSSRRMRFTVLIDRLDDEWDGSDKAVVLVMALMHACIEIGSMTSLVEPIVFLRENVFDRVRALDSEFSRLETSVVSIDWTKELLRELVERRLNNGLITKFSLNGPTWNAFFESSATPTEDLVFDFCQYRPRDVLLYLSKALAHAQAHQHNRILIEDLQTARKQYSESRLKEVADEYADNYPQLRLVLARFYGLGCEFTVGSIEDFIKKLLVDDEIKRECSRWIFRFTNPDAFIELLYDIGFWGIKLTSKSEVRFKTAEHQNPGPLRITSESIVAVHPTYFDALQLQDRVVTSLGEAITLRTSGLMIEIPESFSPDNYRAKLEDLQLMLPTIEHGKAGDTDYEDLVGDVIRLCFFRALQNVAAKVRDVDGRVIRDWMASNRSNIGFWEMIRQRYKATQIVWECKNYSNLSADDFHQVAYYMGPAVGNFAIVSFRGNEITQTYYSHIRRISSQNDGGVVLILGERDLKTFIRQAINGKQSEAHLQDIYDRTIRAIS